MEFVWVSNHFILFELWQSAVCFIFQNLDKIWGKLPWVPEPQNLGERKLVRGKERRKKGEKNFLSFLIFSFYYFLALVPRVGESKHIVISISVHGCLLYKREKTIL